LPHKPRPATLAQILANHFPSQGTNHPEEAGRLSPEQPETCVHLQGEQALIERARSGDAAAFEVLVAPYDRRILSLTYDLLGNAEDARDVYQEALLAVYRALPGFRRESSFATWMQRIAINQALKFRRRRQRQAPTETAAEAMTERASGPTPEQTVLRGELQEQLEQALATLSPQERLAFALCHLQGVKLREAASVMDCSLGSVKSYLFRARDKVRSRLGKYLDG